MKRHWKIGLILGLVLFGVVPRGVAGEHPGSSLGSSKATPMSSTSTPTPQIASAEGSISGLDLQANNLKVTGKDGKVFTLTFDPKATLVWKDTQSASVSDLKIGEQVKIRYMSKEGKLLAKSIDIAQPFTASSSGTKEGSQ